MNRCLVSVSASLLVALVLGVPLAMSGVNRLGVGAHYFKTIDDLEGPYDNENFSFMASYQHIPVTWLTLEADLKLFSDGYAGAREDVISPEVFALFGRPFYAGVGAGLLYAGDESAEDPYLILRAGYEWFAAAHVVADIGLDYRLAAWEGINRVDPDEDSDTVTFGLTLRYEF